MSAPEKKPPLTARLRRFIDDWRGHFAYLQQLLREDSASAWSHWKVSYKEQAALKDAVQLLSARARVESFDWQDVPRVLNQFHLKPDDAGQAEWYAEASREYHAVLQKLEREAFRPAHLNALLKELRFIAEADDFHRRFGLTDLQIRIKTMYQALLQRIDQHNALLKEAQDRKSLEQETEKLRAQEALLAAENEKLAQQNRLVQEQRLKAIEEKKRIDAKREADDAEQKRLDAQREADAIEGERRRRIELEDSFRRIQEAEAMKFGSINAQIDVLLRNLQNAERLSGEDLAATARLFELLRKKFG